MTLTGNPSLVGTQLNNPPANPLFLMQDKNIDF